MAEAGTLHDAFIDELRDTYDAEKQLIRPCSRLAKALVVGRTEGGLRRASRADVDARRTSRAGLRGDRRDRARQALRRHRASSPRQGIMDEDFDEMTMDACLIAAGQRARALRRWPPMGRSSPGPKAWDMPTPRACFRKRSMKEGAAPEIELACRRRDQPAGGRRSASETKTKSRTTTKKRRKHQGSRPPVRTGFAELRPPGAKHACPAVHGRRFRGSWRLRTPWTPRDGAFFLPLFHRRGNDCCDTSLRGYLAECRSV